MTAPAPFVSFSANREDVYLNRLFAGQPTGFYVDAGAAHPRYENDTWALYERGWRGINIEPNDAFFALLDQARPRDRNLHMAVSDSAGELAFYHIAGTGLSTADPEEAERARANGFAVQACRVPTDTLASILAQADPAVIDLLKVDVEGFELKVLQSNDWTRFRPRLVLVEATFPESPVRRPDQVSPFLAAQGYRRLFFDGLNDYYAEAGLDVPPDAFAVPVNVFDRYVPLHEVELAAARDFLAGQVDSLQEERTNAQNYTASLTQALEVERADRALLQHRVEARGVDLARAAAELVAMRERAAAMARQLDQAVTDAAADRRQAEAAQREHVAALHSAVDYANARIMTLKAGQEDSARALTREQRGTAEAGTVRSRLQESALVQAADVRHLQEELHGLQHVVQAMRRSTSWRVTRPLRALARPGRTLRILLGRGAG